MKQEDAVSPVIGVILMVAVTVTLAAVVAAFVFGMAGNMQRSHDVAATVLQQGGDIVVTYHGGVDDNSLEMLKIAVPTAESADCDGAWYSSNPVGGDLDDGLSGDKPDEPGEDNKPGVGAVYTLGGCGTAGKDMVVVVGVFSDGSNQIILQTSV